MVAALTVDAVWRALDEIMDPEIPVVSIVEMGIVRQVTIEGDSLSVAMTPTFAGCPALDVIRAAIEERVRELGASGVEVRTVLSPPWTSDWITPAARAKLQAIGLAPPPRHGGNVELFFADAVACPYCGSTNTRATNNFGPTLCRALYVCRSCRQPFEQFKPI
jgi:ring-1,2-phenylacetyl-CoA epoxidase subunit PaaD